MKQNAGTPHCVNGKKGGSVLRQLIKGLFTLTLFLLTIFLFSGLIVYPLLAITLLQAYLTTFLTPISASPFFCTLAPCLSITRDCCNYPTVSKNQMGVATNRSGNRHGCAYTVYRAAVAVVAVSCHPSGKMARPVS